MEIVDAPRAQDRDIRTQPKKGKLEGADGQQVKHSYRVVHFPALSRANILPLTYHRSVNELTEMF